MNVEVTKHAKKRVKERLGLNKKSIDKNAEKALEFGMKHSDAKGSLKRYFDYLYFQHEIANNIRIYNRKVYIFQNEKLVTVFNLPKKYVKVVDKFKAGDDKCGETEGLQIES